MKVKGRKGLGKSRERWQVRRKKGKEGGREERREEGRKELHMWLTQQD